MVVDDGCSVMYDTLLRNRAISSFCGRWAPFVSLLLLPFFCPGLMIKKNRCFIALFFYQAARGPAKTIRTRPYLFYLLTHNVPPLRYRFLSLFSISVARQQELWNLMGTWIDFDEKSRPLSHIYWPISTYPTPIFRKV